MANNKNDPKGDSQCGMGNKPDREFEGQRKDTDFEKEGQQAGSSAKPSGSSFIENDETNTAGGLQGQFSDEDRESDAKWSPGAEEPHSE